MPTLDIDRDAAHDAAERELGKPIYPKVSLSDRIADWINDLIYRIITKGSTVPGGWFTIIVLLIILVVVIVVAVRVARKTMRTNRGADHRLFGAGELSARQHRELAQQCATRGEWATAMRHRLRAVARHLEETGVLAPVPGRTANELARDAARSLPGLSTELRSAATAFNDVTYGELPGSQVGYQMISDLDDHLRTRPGAGSGPPTDSADAGWAEVR